MYHGSSRLPSEQQGERDAGAQRDDGGGPALAVVPRQVAFLVAVVVASHDVSTHRQVEGETVGEYDVVAAA